MRILIIDDEYVSRTKLKVIMQEYGDCDVAPNGEIGIQMYDNALDESIPYKLITIDVDMPGLRGIEVVNHIRDMEKEKQIDVSNNASKILVISKQHDREMIRTSLSGADAFVLKPVDSIAIKKALADIEMDFS